MTVNSFSCKLSLLSGCAILLSGCTSPVCPPASNTADSRPAVAPMILPPNAGQLDMPLDVALKNIRANAKPGSYRIVGVRPFPYAINLKIAADPQRYIDCGMITVPESATIQATQFPGAKSAHEYRVLIKQIPYQVKRKVSLEVQVTVRLDPHGKQTYY